MKGELESEDGSERESRKREAEGSLDSESPPTKFSPVEENCMDKSRCDDEESEKEGPVVVGVYSLRSVLGGDSFEETSSTQSAESVRSSMSDDPDNAPLINSISIHSARY